MTVNWRSLSPHHGILKNINAGPNSVIFLRVALMRADVKDVKGTGYKMAIEYFGKVLIFRNVLNGMLSMFTSVSTH